MISDDLVSRLRRAVTWQGVVPHGNGLAREAADEIERLRAYTAAYNTLLAERVEIECLRGLAIRAWHSFRSGLTAGGGCDCGLTDADIEELVRLSGHPPT